MSTSAGVSCAVARRVSLARSIAIERSTASSVIGWPVRSTSIISSNSRWTRATSAASPAALTSLPRTWMSTAGKDLLDHAQEGVTRSQDSDHGVLGRNDEVGTRLLLLLRRCLCHGPAL